MKIHSAEFVVSAVYRKDYPLQTMPEIAFVGRSNVGKSSLMNKMLNRKKLVKVSRTPGRTQTVNFFRINELIYFVDLPGYGYARVPQSVRKGFGPMIERYLTGRRLLACVVHIVDARHPPTELDLIMRDYLLHQDLPVLTVATKSDKLPKGKRRKQSVLIREALALGEGETLFFSAVTSEGRKELWKEIQAALSGPPHEGGEK
jgi:GTP-binding protein